MSSSFTGHSDNVSPGITIALTRNLHIRVHSTELNCCLKQSAWCFSSSGFYQFGQEEIVILLRRRFDEKLPPMEIFYQYWLIYQALVNYAEKQVKSDVNFESFNSQTYNRPFGSAPFRSHDCFFEKLYFANDRCSSSPCTDSDMTNGYYWLNSRSLTSSNYGSSNPYGFVFFHPTHQCLLGLHLPNPPFLIALLVHIQEAPWAYHLPSRILLNLGKMSHYYPTTLLSDRDRKILFDCKLDGESFLQLFTNIKPFIYPDFMTFTPKQRCIPLPELLFHINGFYAHLNVVKSESDTNTTTHNDGVEDVIVELLVTGLSFVAFSGHASFCSAIIVEDGLYISMTSLKFHQLVNSLKNGYDLSIPIRSSRNIQPSTKVEHINCDFGDDISNRDLFNGNVASSVHVKWFKVFDSFLSSASFSTTVTPCCTNSAGIWDLEPITTFLVPVHYQLWHWIHLNESIIPSSESQLSSLSTIKSSDPPSLRLAWIRFHVLNVDQLEFISTSSSKTITFGHFSNEVAECVIK
ncbi:MAD, mothers against decapentaplegic interacting protein [Schistosoma bovis]|uniref:MAD, mothers against decapentaplegic interacting protein n=1 Tax=Schistosoma bovis TaxID=6184 RepID=A0A430Q9T4_SCHBO|nr:MAD, mothers against decapentaplegic interacting protein [Schistosoma bovis]